VLGQVVYEETVEVRIDAPYRPGFLAFREVGPLAALVARLRARAPHCLPDALLVDGNGILHERGKQPPRSMPLCTYLLLQPPHIHTKDRETDEGHTSIKAISVC
jgi:hypothetical protein